MKTVNMFEAKSSLSKLVEAVETGAEPEIVLARDGRPVARIVPLAAAGDVSKRIGIAKGKYVIPVETPEMQSEIEAMFDGAKG